MSLGLSFFAFTLFAVALLWARVRLEVAKSRLARAEEDAIDLGLDDRHDEGSEEEPPPRHARTDA